MRTVLVMVGYGREIDSRSQPPIAEAPHEAPASARQPAAARAAVVARDLTLVHGARVAVRAASFTVPEGRVTALIGPNGSGKSTLLDAIAGLHQPAAGTIEVLGDALPRRRAVAYVLQSLHANEQLPVSVREVVTMARYGRTGVLRRLRPADRAAVDAALERLDVARFARRPLGELSGGERQRALVAQALAQEAPLLLLDEPVTGLDLVSQERIAQVLAEEVADGRTVVVSTHSLADAAEGDHLLLLAGRVVAEGAPDEVLTEAHLRAAYGSLVMRVGDGALMVDDGSHHHDHDHEHHLR